MSKLQILIKGLIRENPTFVLLLGMCPTLGTTTSALNGMGMGAATLFVLTLSNIVISMIKNVVPDKVRIPAFIVVIASFVTVVQLCMEAYMPDLYKTLGVYIPLIVVNCIILGAPKRSPRKTECSTRHWTVWHRPGFHAVADAPRSRPRTAGSRSDFRP